MPRAGIVSSDDSVRPGSPHRPLSRLDGKDPPRRAPGRGRLARRRPVRNEIAAGSEHRRPAPSRRQGPMVGVEAEARRGLGQSAPPAAGSNPLRRAPPRGGRRRAEHERPDRSGDPGQARVLGQDGTVKLTGFGLAKSAGESTAAASGSSPTMSPTLSLPDRSTVKVTRDVKQDTEPCCDYLAIQYSTNGYVWTTAESAAGTRLAAEAHGGPRAGAIRCQGGQLARCRALRRGCGAASPPARRSPPRRGRARATPRRCRRSGECS